MRFDHPPQPGHSAPADLRVIPTQIASPSSSADTTATSGSDRNRSSSIQSSTSFTAPDSRAQHSIHEAFQDDRGEPVRRSTITERGCTTEVEPEPELRRQTLSVKVNEAMLPWRVTRKKSPRAALVAMAVASVRMTGAGLTLTST